MKILGELVKRQGNGQCADCGSKGSYTFPYLVYHQPFLTFISHSNFVTKHGSRLYFINIITAYRLSNYDTICLLSCDFACAPPEPAEVEYASYNIGAFLCSRCAVLHNNMGTHVSKTKHLKLDHWEVRLR